MDQQQQQLISRIKQAQNILVTVSADPSVDQLSAAIGLTIALNKQNKHGTAVFSGQVPSTIEFLKPEDTLEKNTDSLRDFIIALDKSKADKLRYKVEDQVVRIFITPYRTSLSQNDLEFSQGDFNVDVVVALGVSNQQDIDAAITAHGRILHDATVASVSLAGQGDLGTINWVDPNASSLSEMVLGLIDGLDKKTLDSQIATALLTGIVANTDRFRNEKTSPRAMSASAELMAAGANQQLIATELEAPLAPSAVPEPLNTSQDSGGDATPKRATEPGELDIEHTYDEPRPKEDQDESNDAPKDEEQDSDVEEESVKEPEPEQPQIHVDEDGILRHGAQPPLPSISQVHGVSSDGEPADGAAASEVRHERLKTPPTLGDVDMTANVTPEDEEIDSPADELTLPAVNAPLLTHNETVLPPPPIASSITPEAEPYLPQAPLQPAPQSWQPPMPPLPTPAPLPPAPTPVSDPIVPLPSSATMPMPTPPPMSVNPPVSPASASLIPNETLEEIEEAVRSSHVQQPAAPVIDAVAPETGLEDARSAVEAALNSSTAPSGLPQPIAALNAQPLGPDLHPSAAAMQPVTNTGFSEPTPGNTPADAALDMPLPSSPFGPGTPLAPPAPSSFPAMPPQGTIPSGIPPVPPPFVPPAPQ
jgi:hypothetical protein